MLVYGVYNEKLCIINPPACLVRKLEGIYQSDCVLDDVCLLMVFITSEVGASGLRSFRDLNKLFFGIGIGMDCFHNWGTVLLSTDFWNKS